MKKGTPSYDSDRKKEKAKYDKAVADGICILCRKRKANPGNKTCQPCLEHKRQKQRENVAKGLCSVGACKNRPTPGTKMCQACRERGKARRSRYIADGRCIACGKPSVAGIQLCQRHLDQRQATILKIKLGCFDAYGGRFCACCREHRIEFLCLDHINGDGKEHRAKLGWAKHGHAFYRWLRRNNYPPGIRVLCANCNLSRGLFGYCPHERERQQQGVKQCS